jgi:MFS family permease
MIQLFQQRDFGDKINVTFQYVTQNFRSLGLSLLYIVGPIALVAGIASGIMQSNLFDLAKSSGNADSGSDPMAAFRMMQNVFSPAFALAGLFSLLAVLVVSLATYAHMKVYGRKTAQRMETSQEPVPISVAEVWEEMQTHIGQGIVVSVLSSIVTVVATLFFVLPGIYVGIVFSLAMAVVVFEGTDFSQTWNRCLTLIRDKWWSTFGLLIVMGIISGLVGLIFTLPAGIISLLIGSKLLPDVSGFWVVVGNVLATVGGTLLRSLIYIALGFQYTNLVERQEGRGLLSAIDSIGTNPTQSRPSDEETY